MDFSVIKPLVQHMYNIIGVNTELHLKTKRKTNEFNGLWEVLENEELLLVPNIDRLENIYNLFTNTRIEMEYIKVSGNNVSLKLYPRSRRIVYSTNNHDTIANIYNLAKSMNLSNLNIVMNL